MKAYITKYALSEGILEREGKVDVRTPTMFCADGAWNNYFHNKDWHLTRELAIQRAEAMRKAKIASLKKQLAKLEGMKFE